MSVNYHYLKLNDYDAESVKKLRQSLGLSQQGMADMLNVSKVTITKWENSTNPVGGPAQVLLTLIENDEEFCKKLLTVSSADYVPIKLRRFEECL